MENKVISHGDLNVKELLRIAASIEKYSEHPIARGILEKAGELGVELLKISIRSRVGLLQDGLQRSLDWTTIMLRFCRMRRPRSLEEFRVKV